MSSASALRVLQSGSCGSGSEEDAPLFLSEQMQVRAANLVGEGASLVCKTHQLCEVKQGGVKFGFGVHGDPTPSDLFCGIPFHVSRLLKYACMAGNCGIGKNTRGGLVEPPIPPPPRIFVTR